MLFEVKPYNQGINGSTGGLRSYLRIQYYGKKIGDFENYDIFGKDDHVGGPSDDYCFARMPYSFVGLGNNNESLVIFENADGSCVNRFNFVDAQIQTGGMVLDGLPYARDGAETLAVRLFDEVAKIAIVQYYTVFSDSDVIAVCQKVVNQGEKKIKIKRLMSLQLDLPANAWMVSTFDGRWGAEFQRHNTSLSVGKMSIESKLGNSSNAHNPFFFLKGVGNNRNVFAFNLIYSGNHKETVEVMPFGNGYTRVLSGVNDFLFDYALSLRT